MRRIALLLLLTGCSLPSGATPIPDLQGWVDFGPGRKLQATIGEVAFYATVSLIDATTNQTVQTTRTDNKGRFLLKFGTWKPGSTVYYFEAVKGLGGNKAGNTAARIRTIGQFKDGGWTSITNAIPGAGMVLSRSTTALSAIASLRGPTLVPPEGLIGKLTVGLGDSTLSPPTPDTFADTDTGITNAQFHKTYGLVDLNIVNDTDPLSNIQWTGSDFTFLFDQPPLPVLYTLYPTSGSVGTTVTLYGDFFGPQNASNSISFNGTNTYPVSSEPTKLVVRVPAGASTGNLTVTTEVGASNAQAFTVTPAAATDISGGLVVR
jgi:hypothetical protein